MRSFMHKRSKARPPRSSAKAKAAGIEAVADGPAPGALARVQRKPIVAAIGDPCEREADRVSELVMRMNAPQTKRGGLRGESRESAKQAGMRPPPLRPAPAGSGETGAGAGAAPPEVRDVLRSAGQPLDPGSRAFMEQRFDRDFSQVRVHRGAAAERSAEAIEAKAYTVGHAIVFGAGQFALASDAGRRLLAHELAHVVQQTGAPPARAARAADNGDPPPAFRAQRAAYGVPRAPIPVTLSSPVGIARQPEDDFGREDDEYRRQTAEDKAEGRGKDRRRGGQGPPTGGQASRDAARRIERMLDKAEAGGYRHVNTANRQRDTNRFRDLLSEYRASEMRRIDERLAKTTDAGERRALTGKKSAINLERNILKGQFDEAMRTPHRAEAQKTYIRGGEAKPYHERKGGSARPDYSVSETRERGGVTRIHVNLKGHDLRDLSEADARAIARTVTRQAIRNVLGNPKKWGDVGHLPGGDRLIISFIDQPPAAIQKAMSQIILDEGSPVAELRFGTATHRPPAASGSSAPPAGPKSQSSKAAGPAADGPLPKGSVFAAKPPAETSLRDPRLPAQGPTPAAGPAGPSHQAAAQPAATAAKRPSPWPEGSVFARKLAAATSLRDPRLPAQGPIPATVPGAAPSKAAAVAAAPAAKGPSPLPEASASATKPSQSRPAPPTLRPKPGADSAAFTRAAVAFDPHSPRAQGQIKLTKLDLTDYSSAPKGSPAGPPSQGSAIRKGQFGASIGLTLLSLIGEAAGGETEKMIEKITNPIQAHFREEMEEARKSFQARFPDSTSLLQEFDVPRHRQAFLSALAKVNATPTPGLLLFALLTSKNRAVRDAAYAELRGNLPAGLRAADLLYIREVGTAYMEAMADLQARLGRDMVILGDAAKDVEKRAAILTYASEDLHNAFWTVVIPAMLHPITYYQSFDILQASKVMERFGNELAGFAGAADARAKQYQYLWNGLDQEHLDVTDLRAARQPRRRDKPRRRDR